MCPCTDARGNCARAGCGCGRGNACGCGGGGCGCDSGCGGGNGGGCGCGTTGGCGNGGGCGCGNSRQADCGCAPSCRSKPSCGCGVCGICGRLGKCGICGCGGGCGLFKCLFGCTGCRGEFYWSEWHNDPPRCHDPCDRCGNWIGPSAGYRAPYAHPYSVGVARPASASQGLRPVSPAPVALRPAPVTTNRAYQR